MIHHELFGQHLRNGNFNFQIAATIALCEKHNCETIYPEYYLWKYLKKAPLIYSGNYNISEIIRPRVWEWTKTEQEWLDSFAEDFRNRDMQLALNFFFQSAKWFEGYEQQVVDFFEFNDDYVEAVKEKYSELFRRPTIGIGLRLGDFKGHGDFYQIPKEFYLRAIQENFPNWQDYNIIIFSDHIEEAKQMFRGENVFFADPNGTHTHADNFKHYHSEKAIEQLVLGTLMDNWVIGNSTFSWWQAFLATYGKTNPKVVHSGKVFSIYGNMKHCDTSNYYYPSWIECDPTNKHLNSDIKKLL